jgi:hypothetical protein
MTTSDDVYRSRTLIQEGIAKCSLLPFDEVEANEIKATQTFRKKWASFLAYIEGDAGW